MKSNILTAMDGLLALLEERDNLKVDDVVHILGVPKERIESWSKMLEKEGILDVHYSLIGGVTLKRGPNFKPIGRKPPETNIPQRIKPKQEGVALISETKRPEAVILKSTAQESGYKLLRDKLVEEESEVISEVELLKREEEQIINYMKNLLEEGERLSVHIKELKKVIEQIEQEKNESKSKDS